jgi:hypothetical protein
MGDDVAYLAAVGKGPDGVDPNTLRDADFVDFAFPGTGSTRLEALLEAFEGWRDSSDTQVPNVSVIEARNQAEGDPFALQVAIGALKQIINKR